MSDKRTAHITRRFKDGQHWRTVQIVATANVGGAYADLLIGGLEGEVINLWDYATSTSELGWKRGELRAILLEWATTWDAEEYQDAAADADDADELAELRRRPRRQWLKTYIDNL